MLAADIQHLVLKASLCITVEKLFMAMQQQLQKISFHTFLPLDLENNRLSSGLELERAHNFEPGPRKFDIEPIWTKWSVISGPIDPIRLLI